MGFARELTILRANRRISLQKLADAVSVSKTHIWQLEKGITEDPSLDIVRRIADFFNVSVQSLVGENPESPNADPKAVAMFRKLGDLDDIDKDAIEQMINSMLERKKRRNDEVRSGGNK